jgi:hypothetical protein
MALLMSPCLTACRIYLHPTVSCDKTCTFRNASHIPANAHFTMYHNLNNCHVDTLSQKV